MIYLFGQMFFWLLAAFILGLVIGWWLHNRVSVTEPEIIYRDRVVTEPAIAETTTVAVTPTDVIPDAWAPALLSATTVHADDLKRIKGIGNKLEQLLNDLGIYTFKQIAAFDKNNITWVNSKLSFSGRIEREGWVEQATQLDMGEETEFSRRLDKGDISYSA